MMRRQAQLFAAATAFLLLGLVSCERKETKLLLEPSQALGTVLAGETVQAAGAKRQVGLILPQWAADSAVGDSFKAALKKQGVTVAFTIVADVGDPMGRQPIGLKASDFFNALEKGARAGAIVSLAGAPLLNAQDAARLDPSHPPVLVVATTSLGNVMGIPSDRGYLSGLLNAKVIHLAIVGAEPDPNAKPAGKTDAAHQLFSQHYRILRAGD